MTFGCKPRGSESVNWKSTLTNLDAGLRPHDAFSLRLKARILTIPESRLEIEENGILSAARDRLEILFGLLWAVGIRNRGRFLP
jgi:hypothetical protein